MRYASKAEAWSAILKHCDGDVEAVSLLIEQVRYEIPPLPPNEIRDAISEWTSNADYADEWSVTG